MFCSNFSRVHMFCDEDSSTLVLESTLPGGGYGLNDCQEPNKKPKIEHLTFELKVCNSFTSMYCELSKILCPRFPPFMIFYVRVIRCLTTSAFGGSGIFW